MPPDPAQRIALIDWLRGLAVILMIQAHGFDAWLSPQAKLAPGYGIIRYLSGVPSRLFLILVGISAAIRFESLISKGADPATMRRLTAKRGVQVLALAYLFRLQEFILAGFKGGWPTVFKVDILNCIGASLIVVALVATPRRGRIQIAAALYAAAIFLGLGPIIGPIHFPDWMPAPLTSYIGGQRPMAWFSLFPWAAWPLAGVAIGHLWLKYGRDPRTEARCFILTGVAGLLLTSTVVVVRGIDPYIIRYPSEVVQQMGPGSFFYRLGVIGVATTAAWCITRVWKTGFSPVNQMGQTSLLIYWIHVDLCYGGISRALRSQLTIPAATFWVATLTLAMLGLSLIKTRLKTRLAAAWNAD